MANAKVRINFNLSEVDYQKLMQLQKYLSETNKKNISITDTLIECINWKFNKECNN